eukprot:4878262-Pleurochrysis_carterae.AAC.1
MEVPCTSAVNYETYATLSVAQVATTAGCVAACASREHRARRGGERSWRCSLDNGVPDGGGARTRRFFRRSDGLVMTPCDAVSETRDERRGSVASGE